MYTTGLRGVRSRQHLQSSQVPSIWVTTFYGKQQSCFRLTYCPVVSVYDYTCIYPFLAYSHHNRRTNAQSIFPLQRAFPYTAYSCSAGHQLLFCLFYKSFITLSFSKLQLFVLMYNRKYINKYNQWS